MTNLHVSQLAATNMIYSHFTLEYFLDSMVRLDISNIEFWAGHPHFHFDDLPTPQTAQIGREFRKRGLKMVSLMPEQNIYAINIAAKEDYLRSKSVNTLSRFISAAAELDCKKFLLCPGKAYLDRPYSEGWKYSRDSVEKLTRKAESEGITLMFECLNWEESCLVTNKEAMNRMIKEVNSPNLKCAVDTVPVCTANETLEEYFSLLGDNIIHIHLNDGTPSGHLAWGDGNQNLEEHLNTLRKYNYQGYITMELAGEDYRMEPEKHYARNLEYLKKYFDCGGEQK